MELKPISRAPSLSTFNSVGFGVYGARDRDDDGAYSLTRFIVILFIPIFPIDAYRVYAEDGGGWHFVGKTVLPAWQRLWQRGMLAAIVFGIISGGLLDYLNNPDRLLDKEVAVLEARVADAQTAEQRAELVADYEKLLAATADASAEDQAGELPQRALGLAYLRALIAEVPQPVDIDHIEAPLQVVARIQAQPRTIRRGDVSNLLHETVGTWLQDFEQSEEAGIYAALQLADDARASLVGDTPLEWQQEDALRARLAAQLEAEWPQDALRLYVESAGRGDAGAQSAALLNGLELAPSVWLELEPTLRAWLDIKVPGDAASAARTKVDEHFAEAAKSTSPDIDEVLEEPNPTRLQSEFKKFPGDHRIAVALADLQRDKGEGEAALEALAKLGTPGQLSRRGQLLVADIYTDLGRLEEADALLQRIFSIDMPAYARARQVYYAAYEVREDELYAQANNGGLGTLFQAELNAMSQKDAQIRFREWVDEKLRDDNKLIALRSEMQRQSHIVPVSLSLGMVKLNRASAVEGVERKRLLASAERAFLAIQSEAGGAPSYHLGLGQVYYRLGKSEKGDEEIDQVVALDDVQWTLSAARVYRALGVDTKANALATKVYEASSNPVKSSAAVLLALTADSVEDREMWLRRADPKDEYVRMSLLELEAHRLRDEGKYAEADAKFEVVFEAERKDAATDSASANNAALVAASRYSCTGDPERLKESVRLMEIAVELSPDNSIAASNAGRIYNHLAQIDVLRRWVSTEQLRLQSGEADSLIGTLLGGPLAEQVRTMLGEHPDLRRSLERHRQAEVLAPQMLGTYYAQSRIAQRLRRADALESLAKRLRRNDSIEFVAAKSNYEETLSGAHDERERDDAAKSIARLQPLTLEAPKRTARTRAAAWILLSEVYLSQSELEEGKAPAEKAAHAAREALRLWPESGADTDLQAALLKLGMLQAADKSAALAHQWKKDGRRFGAAITILHVINEGAEEKVAALASAPALREYARLRAPVLEADADRASLGDFVVGRLLEDKVLLAAGERHLSIPRHRSFQEIIYRLAPYAVANEEYLDLMKAKAN